MNERDKKELESLRERIINESYDGDAEAYRRYMEQNFPSAERDFPEADELNWLRSQFAKNKDFHICPYEQFG